MSRSVVATLLAHAAARPESVAFVDDSGALSYAALARDIASTAARLLAWGARAGDTIALALDDAPQHALPAMRLFYAAALAGTKLVLLYPNLPQRRREELIGMLGAKLVDARRFEREAPPAAGQPPRDDDPGRPFLYQFTTGSTGSPKALLFTHAELAAHMAQIAGSMGSSPLDRLLPAVPWPSSVGLRHLLWIHAAGGAFVNCALPLERPALAELIRRHGITQVRASPPQMRLLLASAVPPGFRMPPLHALSVGGAPVSPQELRTAREALTPNTYVAYGATEIGTISLQHPEDPEQSGARLGQDITAEVVDAHGRTLPAGTPGMLRLRVPLMPRGYAIGDSAQQFREGWFYPGDLARFDADGRLTLLGRSDDTINRGGIKIDPRALERALAEHPRVREVAVVGAPDPVAGEVPVAFLVLDGAPDRGQLIEFWQQRIVESHMPAQFRLVAALERSPDGKILYGRLREIIAAQPH